MKDQNWGLKITLKKTGVKLKLFKNMKFWRSNMKIGVLKIIWKLKFWKLNLRIENLKIKVWKIKFENWSFENDLKIRVLKITWKLEFFEN